MKTRILVGVMLCCLCVSAKAESKASDPATMILTRYCSMLVEGDVMDAKEVREHMANIKEDGSWADVNYKGTDRRDWEPFYHIFRLGALSKAYARPGHALHGDKALMKTILLAIDHWLANDYKCANGWYNTTATPDHFSRIAMYINDDLTGDRREATMAIVGVQKGVRGKMVNQVNRRESDACGPDRHREGCSHW